MLTPHSLRNMARIVPEQDGHDEARLLLAIADQWEKDFGELGGWRKAAQDWREQLAEYMKLYDEAQARMEELNEKLDGLLCEGRYVLANKTLADDLLAAHARIEELENEINGLRSDLRLACNGQ